MLNHYTQLIFNIGTKAKVLNAIPFQILKEGSSLICRAWAHLYLPAFTKLICHDKRDNVWQSSEFIPNCFLYIQPLAVSQRGTGQFGTLEICFITLMEISRSLSKNPPIENLVGSFDIFTKSLLTGSWFGSQCRDCRHYSLCSAAKCPRPEGCPKPL